MNERRILSVRIACSVLSAFVISMAFTWFVHIALSEREANKLLDQTFRDVSDEIGSRVNNRLLRQCMAVRDRLDAGYPTDSVALQRLAHELQVTEIFVADNNGDLIYSTDSHFLKQTDASGKVVREAFNFEKAGGQAAEMMRLITTLDTEYCQPLGKNSSTGAWRKYVGVWHPSGGFVEIGCDREALRSLSRSALVDLFRNWHVGGVGGIVVTTTAGLVLSDYAEPNRAGMQWTNPDDSYYWKCREIDGFPTYVMIPKNAAAVQRDVLVGATAALNGAALIFVAILVAIVIAAFVRKQLRTQAAKEMKMATEIQTSALPSVFPPFPEERSFDIYANMRTAKEVGGDFYDFYFTGPRTVAFVVADVSGKGVPAAMFMMRAKTLLKSTAQTGRQLAEVVSLVNDALCEGNDANMFVTAWIGQLDILTGVVTFVNAGHNPPIALRRGDASYLHSKPSLVLGAMPGVVYRSEEFQLKPGEAVYLYTDGITEQSNSQNELWGEGRLLEIVKQYDYNQKALLENVVSAVKVFAGDVEQGDDCTQLVISYRGTPKIMEYSYLPRMDELAKATSDLEVALEDVPMTERMKLMVAADEIFANIVKYSDASSWKLVVEYDWHPNSVRLVFIDDGKPFDPLNQRDPDTTLDAVSREVGGLGILIVKKTMSPVTYIRKDGRNILTIGLDIAN